MPYHVRITQKSRRTNDEVKLDLSKEQLDERILKPYSGGRAIVISGKTIPLDDIERIRITYTKENSAQLFPIVRAERRKRRGIITLISDEWYVADKGKDVTDEFIKGPPRIKRPIEKYESSKKKVTGDKIDSTFYKYFKIIAATAIVYYLLGTIVYVNSITLYDYFENDFSINPYYPDKELSFSIHNKAGLSLPWVNPFFLFKVGVLEEPITNTYAFFSGRQGIKRNFSDVILDVGLIRPDEPYVSNFVLHLTEESASFKMEVYINLFKVIRIKVASKAYNLEYQGNSKYTITMK